LAEKLASGRNSFAAHRISRDPAPLPISRGLNDDQTEWARAR
jgi:hypothetical protein